jgi:hypothetical protein
MADRKISDLTALTTPASGDYVPIVDISEVAAASKNKRVTIQSLFQGIPVNVGIGTSSPDTRLHVADGQIKVANSGAINPTIIFTGNGAGASGFQIGQRYNAQELFIYDTSALADRVVVDSSGRLGLGTSSPAVALDVVGQVNSTVGFAAARFAVNTNPLSTTSTAQSFARFTSTGGDFYIGTESSTAGGFFTGSTAYAACLYNSAATPIQFFTGGTIRATLNSTGLGIGTTSPSTYSANLAVFDGAGNGVIAIAQSTSNTTLQSNGQDFYINLKGSGSTIFRRGAGDTESARIDGSGRLLVGTSSARSVGAAGVHQFTLEGVGYNASSSTLVNNENNDQPCYLTLGKSRGAAVGSNTIVQNGDVVGIIDFAAADGSSLSSLAARISASIDGTPGVTDMPGRLVFSVTADGAAFPTEALRISNDRSITVSDGGNVVLGTTTGTKIGTATTQKLGFYNATPVVQPTAVADATTAVDVITQLNDLLAKLRTLGIIAT